MIKNGASVAVSIIPNIEAMVGPSTGTNSHIPDTTAKTEAYFMPIMEK